MDRTQQPADLTGHIDVEEHFSFRGGHGDIRRGMWNNGEHLQAIAVKLLRPPQTGFRNPIEFGKKFRREVQVWKRCKHDNIVILLGTVVYNSPFYPNEPPAMGMVSPWMQNGNLINFLGANHIDSSQRLQLLREVSAGIIYLHSKNIIHGDLTGANVLIDDAGRACLVDFGLSFIKVEFEGTSYWSSTVGGAMRWRAPELLPPLSEDVVSFKPNLTSACDIYSFGGIMLHVMSGEVPYHNITHEAYVLIQLLQGRRPERPPNPMLTDAHWEFIASCWDSLPISRPSAGSVQMSIVEFAS